MGPPEPTHETPIRVRYGEVDRMGVVYHAHYLVYFEQGRTELLRSLGGTYRGLEDEGNLLVVVESGVKHFRPASYDDLLVVSTRLAEVRGVRMRFEYAVRRGEDLLAEGFTVLASTDRAGRPRRLPPPLAALRTGPAGRSDGADGVEGGPGASARARRREAAR
jgi:acyl-CoA thioester hydrolase